MQDVPRARLREKSTGAIERVQPADQVVAQAAERFAERARAQHHMTRRRAATLGSVGGALLVLAWVVLGSPVFALDPAQVGVVCTSSLVSTDEVVATVRGHAGVPLPRLDTVALRDELLTVRGVQDVRITRDWPRGVTVEVMPRELVAAVPDEQGFALLDAEGQVLARVGTAPDNLPVVDVPAGDSRTLGAVLGVLDALPDELAGQVVDASAATQDTVTLTLRSGVEVVWGSSADSALKAQDVLTLVGDTDLGAVSTIDVSAPTLPVVR